MSLRRLWAFLAVALPVLATLIGSLATVDLTYHLRAGGEILDTGVIPSVDTWTFTAAGIPWVDQQWGAQVMLAGVFRIGGWTGLVLFRAVLVAIIFGCIFVVCRRQGMGVRESAVLTLISFAVSAVALGLRAQAIGMACFAVALLLVADRRAHPGRLWAVPVLVVLWANVHGSFFFGPLLLGLAWLEDLQDRAARPHRTLLVAIVAALAACVTPLGPSVWVYAAGLTTNPQVTNQILEWQPTSIRTVPGLFFFGSVIATVAVIARLGRRVPWPTLAFLLVFFVIGVYAARGVAWWPLAVVLPLAGLLAPATAPAAPEPVAAPLFRRLNAVIVGLLLLVGVVLLPVWRPIDPRLNAPEDVVSWAPPGITAALRTLTVPGDRLFNPQEWGSWFEFTLPYVLVGIDSRIEMYPAQVWGDYDKVLAGRDGWQQQLTAWRVTIAAIATRDQGLADRLSAIGWRTVYSDKDGSVAVAPGR